MGSCAFHWAVFAPPPSTPATPSASASASTSTSSSTSSTAYASVSASASPTATASATASASATESASSSRIASFFGGFLAGLASVLAMVLGAACWDRKGKEVRFTDAKPTAEPTPTPTWQQRTHSPDPDFALRAPRPTGVFVFLADDASYAGLVLPAFGQDADAVEDDTEPEGGAPPLDEEAVPDILGDEVDALPDRADAPPPDIAPVVAEEADFDADEEVDPRPLVSPPDVETLLAPKHDRTSKVREMVAQFEGVGFGRAPLVELTNVRDGGELEPVAGGSGSGSGVIGKGKGKEEVRQDEVGLD
ncbi:hypothetical protein B0H16DRAFT_1887832 [Mycena metata]|uniref:Transmembrane protein n=1 Tax=Mycena metata TaxID=1033252 RepID=A0AAD7N7L5_9AGAR|nr:hypothetical protein B0H16DRAFT_1887830 [Mycena metata]KAJ7750212.1 hypothetical protein B0H16DRAFT_1887832 [Mycena metata]